MAEYSFREIEKKWQDYWEKNKIYATKTGSKKPKYYVLDMFPYPSGAGLHVGHPLGYIASDIAARYKRHKGFNVLHPMGFDSFGLPAEQHAVETGQHPAVTTDKNIKRYKEQLKNIGFSYDWDREVRTSSPSYYKWTQWIFMQLFRHWYNKKTDKAEPVEELISHFESAGNKDIEAACDEDTPLFSSEEWNGWTEKEKEDILQKYRLTYLADMMVNWCPGLGTVLANEEVKDGVSERGGFPVERKKMSQWVMRTTAYAERLLQGLDTVDWPEPMKEMQRNWIGKSTGAEVFFPVEGHDFKIKVFTTRVDTTFGVTYMSLAPENELVDIITTSEYKDDVNEYVEEAKNRSELDRMSDVKRVSGQFTGAYCINPFNNERIPIWIADYVLAGYGTGAVMAVPSSDTRDYAFAKKYDLKIIPVQEGEGTDITKEDFDPKKGTMVNSGFLNGLEVPEAIEKAVEYAEKNGIGNRKVNYKMHDSIFSRQRYWGEPFPVYYKDGIPQLLKEEQLPLELPEINEYKPTEDGDPPLGRAIDWKTAEGYPLEMNTMPGWAGSSWYYLRYMDPKNDAEPFSKEAQSYWNQVDLYIGGSEHATGHLLYSRFWNKFLKDTGRVKNEEPFKKLINQGMIQGNSKFVYRISGTQKFVSKGLRKNHDTTAIHVDITLVNSNDELDIEGFRKWREDFANAEFELEDGKYICGSEVEKMSKSKYNVVNPDDVVEQYGADTLRMYEMFLGPVEQAKPWNTHGIDGVYKFLRKFWHLFHKQDNFSVSDDKPSVDELKVLHKTLKKVEEDIQRHSYNTVVSTFMICVNDLGSLKCNKKDILEPLVIALSPFAPHLSEELWQLLGHQESVSYAPWPEYNEEFIKENEFEYPVSVNGKMRAKMKFPVDISQEQVEEKVLASEDIQKWLKGKDPKKIIYVPKRIVNVVV